MLLAGKSFQSILLLVLPRLLFGVPSILPVTAANAETIRGTVRYKSEDDAGKTVVYIEKASGAFWPPYKHPIMDQIELTFVPYVLPVLIGTTVDFHNSDDILNNIFTPSWAGRKFTLGTYPKGGIGYFTFARLGEVALLCNIHPDMEGYILVLQNPYFAVPDKDGKYQIPNVPPGAYNLKIWYKSSISPVKDITVKKGKELVVV